MTDRDLHTRIPEDACAHYEAFWPDAESGAGYVAACWPALYRSGLEEVAGQFSKGELAMILEAMENVVLRPEAAGRHLLPAVREGIARNRLNEKWKVKSRPFLDRVTALTRFQSTVLELWASAFRRGRAGGGGIERYARDLA